MWESIIKIFSSLQFFATILPGQAAVLCRFGKYRKTYPSSMIFIIPFVHDVSIVAVAEQIKDMRAQSLTTRDGKAILVGGKLRYSVSDPALALHQVLDFDEALCDETLGLIATECMKRTWAECRDHIILANEVEKAVRRTAKKWGIEINGFSFTDLVEHRVLRIEGNSQFQTDMVED